MVNEGRGRLFKRSDDKYLVYLPVDLAEDSMFPFKNWQEDQRTGEKNSIRVKVSFKRGVQRLIIEEWKEPEEQ
jgi:hypothetical protein